MNVSDSQTKWLDKREKEGLKKIFSGRSWFRLDDYQCSEHLGVRNDTLSKPYCEVESVSGDEAYIKASFFSGGTPSSYPTYSGTVPTSIIKYEHSLLLVMCLVIYNTITRGKT